ncbi:MAG: hypothetical protein Q4F83_05015 [Eubacteriales bacterium]|nr:hypothetical protein [Eubacteriales bacterium]
MDIWNVLGIVETNNTGEIKRAYARALLKWDAEKNPEEFSQLHSAYKAALEMCSSSSPKDDVIWDMVKDISIAVMKTYR